MRLSELTLERYGRFEGCNLMFRPGETDLHVIYGANETGKSTTMAAVADLLFGFPARSSQNYRFDYPLLRVGAVLEEDGRRFACRRRKANAQSLVDAEDRPIDEGPLSAMLRGQDRERFWRGFSLDQTRLREGGEAMAGAEGDLGQALFAAGSGLTDVRKVLAVLEREADAVWGPRAAQRRLYTVAERSHKDAQGALRDLELKPKAWIDARTDGLHKAEALEALERERAALAHERRGVERLRRVGPDVRRRAELLAAGSDAPAVIPTPHALLAAEAALTALAEAERSRFTASALLEELDREVAALTPDEPPLECAAELEALVERRGAEDKAALDRVRREVELRDARAREARLQTELGGSPPVASRLAVAQLREIAGRHGQAETALGELRASAADAELRVAPLRLALADAPLSDSLPDLVAAIDAARTLGDDLDGRCDEGAVQTARLETQARAALARTAPWSGPVEARAALPDVGAGEIDAALAAATAGARALEEVQGDVRRAAELIAQLELERVSLAEGEGAIAAERIVEARGARDAIWTDLRAHLLGAIPLLDPAGETAAYEAALARADAVADLRFTLAEVSGRLAALDARAAAATLDRAQAEASVADAERAVATMAGAWGARLSAAGLPALQPVRLRAWLDARDAALRSSDDATDAREAWRTDLGRRAAARARLAALLPERPAPAGDALAPLLEQAAKVRGEGEEQARLFRDGKAAVRELEKQLADLAPRATRAQSDLAVILSDWMRETSAAGLDLRIAGAAARLAILDELRAESDAADLLATRIVAIDRDAAAFAADVASLAGRLGEADGRDAATTLDALRARLGHARSAAEALARLKVGRQARTSEVRAALIAAEAARAALRPVMAELRVTEVGDLPPSIEAAKAERNRREELVAVERRIAQTGDGLPLAELTAACETRDADALAAQADRLDRELTALDPKVTVAADAAGAARRTFETLETGPGAAQAAADAALSRAEMDAHAEAYLLKRSQTVVLGWVMDRYRERQQNPLLVRASALFSTLTLGRYRELRIDADATPPRLLGVYADGARAVGVGDMSEGTTDQLFLALRLAAVEQAIAASVRLPFLADDLFVNFDDDRACAGLRVLAELARSTQVLIFTHHPHLLVLARETVGADTISECPLPH